MLDSSINFSRASTLKSLKSTKSSSKGLNSLTRDPVTDDSPRGRCLASKT
uniref:Protein disulfide-isomerase n=1 Tax=Rhizophora mucronata TaxID=61149 RepID=A0A2P2JIW5_RHIMU